MAEPLGIGLLGCGTVGGGVAKLLLEASDRLAARALRPMQLRRIAVRHPDKPRAVAIPPSLLTTDCDALCADPAISVGVELIGGLEPARTIILRLLAAGKDVVTANKAVLARHGEELFEAARRYGRTIAFEASVGGGIPIVSALRQGLAANRIDAILAILNGTSNYVLTRMTEHGESYADALADAQRLGYAEADPTLDVDGTDAAQKLCILARLAFGRGVPLEVVEKRGIDRVALADVRFASELGYVIKLLAEAWLEDRQLALHVEPTLVRRHAPLAEVRGPYNAIQVLGDAVGDTLYFGRGAGQMATASAVVADLIDLAIGRGQLTFQATQPWLDAADVSFRSSASIQSRFYLRINAQDRPGVLADVAGILARHDISIASVVQHEAMDDGAESIVPVVIMTHEAKLGSFRESLRQIDALASVVGPSVHYPVAE